MKAHFEEFLRELCEQVQPAEIRESIEYSLYATSKRLRPLLLLSVIRDYEQNVSIGLEAAAALEMIHTYSLIHDDLPAMDDDDFRRGIPSNHKQFSEATAILAGDALQSLAFETLTNANLSDKAKIQCIRSLSYAAGANGMIMGQAMDLAGEKTALSFDEIMIMYVGKTGRLFACALEMGAICAGHTEDLPLLTRIGENLGILFQMQDDVLEATSDEATLGKSLSDQRHQKSTVVSLIGISGTKEKINRIYQDILDDFSQLTQPLKHTLDLIEYILQRNS